MNKLQSKTFGEMLKEVLDTTLVGLENIKKTKTDEYLSLKMPIKEIKDRDLDFEIRFFPLKAAQVIEPYMEFLDLEVEDLDKVSPALFDDMIDDLVGKVKGAEIAFAVGPVEKSFREKLGKSNEFLADPKMVSRIFGTVIKIMESYIKKTNPTALYFSADAKEGSRKSLYRVLLRRFKNGLKPEFGTLANNDEGYVLAKDDIHKIFTRLKEIKKEKGSN